VEHEYGCGPLPPDFKEAKVEVFQHRLQQLFQLSIFCKMPVQPIVTTKDLRNSFMVITADRTPSDPTHIHQERTREVGY